MASFPHQVASHESNLPTWALHEIHTDTVQNCDLSALLVNRWRHILRASDTESDPLPDSPESTEWFKFTAVAHITQEVGLPVIRTAICNGIYPVPAMNFDALCPLPMFNSSCWIKISVTHCLSAPPVNTTHVKSATTWQRRLQDSKLSWSSNNRCFCSLQ